MEKRIVPFIEGDGIGSDITKAMHIVVNHAVKLAYKDEKEIEWLEVLAGQKAFDKTGEWLPEETLDIIREHGLGIKGPLTTPVGGGIRSLNVAMRHNLDLFCCQRPIQYFEGVPSPMKSPEKIDVVVFRENSEDIYCGIEFEAKNAKTLKLIEVLKSDFDVKISNENTAIGVKLISEEASKKLIRRAIDFAILENKTKISLVHKGNIMKFTEGAFVKWGYELLESEYNGKKVDYGYEIINPNTNEIIEVTDVIADACFQQLLLKPETFQVIATMNLNGDYLSDAIAAQVGGIGIAPGANIGDNCAVFEATHGTAPSYENKNLANPSSLILSSEMMLRYMGWDEASDLIIKGMRNAILKQQVTQDFSRHMENVEALSTSDFAKAICDKMTL